MANSSTNKADQEQVAPHISPSTIALEELRHLLLAPEQTQLDHLRERLDKLKVEASEVAIVLAEAIRRRSQESNDLKESLAPIVKENLSDEFPGALQSSIKKNPEAIASHLEPILLDAILKAVMQKVNKTIEEVVQKVHQSKIGELVQAINQADSPFRRLRWWIRSLWAGRSYEEIRNADLLARIKVTDVFLIHHKTGLLVSRVAAADEPDIPEDTMASMLAGIKETLNKWGIKMERRDETISVENLDSPLETHPLTANSKVVLAKGKNAYLAVVMRGTPFDSWSNKVAETMKAIDKEFGKELENFRGKADGFERTRPLLEGLLAIGQKKSEHKRSILNWATITLGIILLLLFYFSSGETPRQKFKQLVEEERKKELKLFITAVDEENGKFLIQGLHDPSLTNEAIKTIFGNLAEKAGLPSNAVDFRIVPYLPLSTEYVERLAKIFLRPPSTVTLSVSPKLELTATGIGEKKWISQFRQIAPLIPGISGVNADHLQDQALIALTKLRNSIESFHVTFSQGRSDLTDETDSTMKALARDIIELNKVAQVLDANFMVEIQGYASQEGSDQVNERLSLRRATKVSQALELAPLSRVNVLTVGKGEGSYVQSNKNQDFPNNRRVAVQVFTNANDTKPAKRPVK